MANSSVDSLKLTWDQKPWRPFESNTTKNIDFISNGQDPEEIQAVNDEFKDQYGLLELLSPKSAMPELEASIAIQELVVVKSEIEG